MSLRDAITEIADQMEKELSDLMKHPSIGDEYPIRTFIGSFIRQLRTAVKASPEESKTTPLADSDILRMTGVDPDIVKKAQDRQQQRAKQIEQVESRGSQMIEISGGGSDGTMITIEPGMPQDAHTSIGGEIYTRKGNILQFDQEETLKLRNKMGGR